MQYYANQRGNSAVRAFEIGEDFVLVQFNTGAKYLYSYKSAGKVNIETMKVYAMRGYGLNGFINSHVKFRYERRVYN
jgi:hypothetical protein